MHLQEVYLIATQKTKTKKQKAKERELPQKKKVLCQSIPQKAIFSLHTLGIEKDNNISPFADGYCCVRQELKCYIAATSTHILTSNSVIQDIEECKCFNTQNHNLAESSH